MEAHEEAIDKAARWLASQKEPKDHVIHELKVRFGLSAVQAAQACTLANEYRRAEG